MDRVRVVLVSPGDVAKERELAQSVLDEFCGPSAVRGWVKWGRIRGPLVDVVSSLVPVRP